MTAQARHVSSSPPPPAIIVPGMTRRRVAEFGVLRLTPTRLRVMPGTLMAGGGGELLTWRA